MFGFQPNSLFFNSEKKGFGRVCVLWTQSCLVLLLFTLPRIWQGLVFGPFLSSFFFTLPRIWQGLVFGPFLSSSFFFLLSYPAKNLAGSCFWSVSFLPCHCKWQGLVFAVFLSSFFLSSSFCQHLHFLFQLQQCWLDFNQTWSECCPGQWLPSVCFLGGSRYAFGGSRCFWLIS